MRFPIALIVLLAWPFVSARAQSLDDDPPTVRSLESIRREHAAYDASIQKLVAVVRGKVLTLKNNPVAGIRVKLLDETGRELSSAITDSKGRISFEHLTPGVYKIFCENSRFYEKSVTIPIMLELREMSSIVMAPPAKDPPIGDGARLLIATVGSVASAVTPMPYKIGVILVVGGIQYFTLPDPMKIEFDGEPIK